MNRLSGQHVLIVGGTSGIGKAVAQLALELGASVTVASRSATRTASLRHDNARMLTVDVADRESLEAMFSEIGGIDHVCLAAGPSALASEFSDLEMGVAKSHFDQRLWAAFHVAQLAGARLAGRGSLTFIIGALSRKPMRGRAVTTAAQCAVEGLARGLAIDLAPVRVNTIVAGLTDTPMWSGLSASARRSLFDKYAASTPAGRIGMATDVAHMVLAAMMNPYVTGASLVVDGGSTIT